MPYARRWKWLRDATGETTVRGVGRACDVTHTTVRRWLESGIPMGALSALIIKFHQDPIEAVVVWGYLPDEHIQLLNFEALVRYIPIAVLAAELSRRADEYSKTRTDYERKASVGMLRRANQ